MTTTLIKAVAKAVTNEGIAKDPKSFIDMIRQIDAAAVNEAETFAADIVKSMDAVKLNLEKAERIQAQIDELKLELVEYKPKRSRSGHSPSRPREQRSDFGPVSIDDDVYSSLSAACKSLRDDKFNRSALENFKWLVKNEMAVTFLNTQRTVETEADYLELIDG